MTTQAHDPAETRHGRASSARPEDRASLTMRELGKLTADQVGRIDHPMPVTSSGRPVAWLVPLSASERRRAEMIVEGRLRPSRVDGLAGHVPLPPVTDGPPLSEVLLEMREQERS